MAQNIPTFDEYVASLGEPAKTQDPTVETAHGVAISTAGTSLEKLETVTPEVLVDWLASRPKGQEEPSVLALGLTVGLSKEKMINHLRHALGTAGYVILAKERPHELVAYLEDGFGLVRLLDAQRRKVYAFSDMLVERSGSRTTAKRAGKAGRSLEDEIEAAATALGLPYVLRGRFEGRGGITGPFDLAVPAAGAETKIIVAAKHFASTGSKLSDAVQEIKDVAANRKPTQYVYAVIDGIGWKGRLADLRRLYDLWETEAIDGMYTSATLGVFQDDLAEAARRLGLLPTP